MTDAPAVNVPRLIAIVTLLFAILVGFLVYFEYGPRVTALEYRIEDAETALRSGEVAASEMPHLREERDALAARYARLLRQNAEAVFLRELVSLARSRGLTLVTTSLARASRARRDDGARAQLLLQTHATLELRGSYRDLLVAIAALSTGSEIVAVETPNLRRDGTLVVASVPITIYEPARTTDLAR